MLRYSRRTEEAYVYWCRVFIQCHGVRRPAGIGGPEVGTAMAMARTMPWDPADHLETDEDMAACLDAARE